MKIFLLWLHTFYYMIVCRNDKKGIYIFDDILDLQMSVLCFINYECEVWKINLF